MSREAGGAADFARGLSASALGRVGAVIDVLAVPLLVWAYGVVTFGAYAAMAAALTLGLGSLDMGLGAAMQRAVPDGDAQDAGRGVAMARTALLAGCAPALIVACAAAALIAAGRPAHGGAMLALAAALPLAVALDLGGAAARARRRFGSELAIRSFAEPTLRLLLALGVAGAAGPSLAGLALAHLAAVAMSVGLMGGLLRRAYPEAPVAPPPGARRAMHRHGLALAPGALLRRALADGPLLLLPLIVPGAAGQAAAASFAFARKLASVPQLLRTLIASVLPPLTAAARSPADGATLGALLGTAYRLAAALALPLGAIFLAMTPGIVALAGPALAGALWPALLLIAARTAESLAAPAAVLTETLSRPLVPLAIAGAGALLWAGAALGLRAAAPHWPPAMAMAAAVALAVVAMAGGALWLARGWWPADVGRCAAASLACAGAAGAATYAAQALPPLPSGLLGLLAWAAGGWAALRWGLRPADHAALGGLAATLRLERPGNRP